MFKSTKTALKLGSENVWIYCVTHFDLHFDPYMSYINKNYINNSILHIPLYRIQKNKHPTVWQDHLGNSKHALVLKLPSQTIPSKSLAVRHERHQMT